MDHTVYYIKQAKQAHVVLIYLLRAMTSLMQKVQIYRKNVTWLSFAPASLLPRHALTTAHTGHLCWPANKCGHSHPLLVPLHTGGLRVARGGSSHCM